MKKTIVFLLKLLAIPFFLGILFTSCNSDEVNDPVGEPPEMPPISTFQMDFSPFIATVPLAKSSKVDTTNKTSWAWASLNGAVWQTLIAVGMAIPVAAFTESFNHDPQQTEDGRWLWTYQFSILGGVMHTASLYGSVDNDGVTWEMYISKENFYQNFLWYSGHSDIFASVGTWTLFTEPNNPTPLIGIEWERNKEDSTGSIKYTNIIPNGPENGGYIYHGVTADLDYDAFYEIYNKGKNNVIRIRWNRQTHEGRVQDNQHFGNEEWHCWNSNLENIDCQ